MYCHLHNDYINCESKNALSIIQSLDKIICVSDFIGRRVLSVSDMANVVTLHNGVAIKTSSDMAFCQMKNLLYLQVALCQI